MRYDRQRTLVIRIAAMTLASDSATTIARFRPAKLTRANPSRHQQPTEVHNLAISRRVSNATLANAVLVLNSNKLEIFTMGDSVKNDSKKPWACIFTLPPCRKRCCFSKSALFLQIQNTKVASAEVAFDAAPISGTF